MMKPTNDATAHEHEEAPNEFLLGRRTALLGLLGGTLTSVSGLLSPAFGQSTIKQATEIGDTLENIPNMCRVASATIEGPYYIDQRIIRSDIREKQPGVPLELELRLVNASGGCRPINGALVSIWHCNAAGEYSGYLFNDPNVMPNPSAADASGHVPERDAERWLRGAQITDADGKVTFRTIVPGWYTPRAPHIHVRAFLNDKTMIVTQLYFPQALNNTIQSTHKDYKGRGVSIYTNENDILLRPEDIMKVSTKSDGSLRATMTLGAGYV
jgi:protocatechuate 3,4-dioxygenase beta subunit